MNGQAAVLFVASEKLQLERVDNGVIATQILDGKLSDFEEWFPAERIRKTVGKRAEALETEPEAPKAKRAVKGAEAS